MSTQNRLASLLSLLSLVAASRTPSAQTWTQVQTSTRPPACKASAMVYDGARGVVVLFCMPKGVANAQTWEWNGSTWTQVVLALQPPAREFPAIAYDSLRHRVVLFGGLLNGLTYPIPPTSFLDDTWEYDGTSWQKMQPQHAPPGRMESMMTFDSGRGRCVLFGGGIYTGVIADTWEWDGFDWVLKTPVTQPPARASAPLDHDPVRGVSVLYGGLGTGGTYLGKPTWEYDGTTWTSVTTPVDPGFSVGHGMAYDAGRHSMVMTHGYSVPYPSTDTWEYTGTNWIRRTPSVSALPPQRQWAGFCFDTARGNFVLFGGTQFGSDLHLDDTWIYTPPSQGSATPFGTTCPGSAGAATLTNIGVPELGRTFQLKVASAPAFVTVAFCLGASDRQWAGTPLPLDLGPFGMTGCRLFVSLDLMLYTSTGPAGWCTVPVAVPADASLAGQRVYTQFGVWDPAANPGGLTTTNGLALVVGS